MNDCLLHRVADGDSAAVRELLDRYGGLVFALARRFCLTQGDVDDAVQDIFAAIWQSAARYDPNIGSEETFVAMVTRRRLIDRRRRAQRRFQANVDADLGQVVADGKAAAAVDRQSTNEDAQRALELLGTLRPEQQTAIRLSICQGLSHEEISKITGMPLGTVKTHVRRGLIALREAMSPISAKTGQKDNRGLGRPADGSGLDD